MVVCFLAVVYFDTHLGKVIDMTQQTWILAPCSAESLGEQENLLTVFIAVALLLMDVALVQLV